MARLHLPGRTALITGGARGIGLALGEAMHARGMNVVLVDLHQEAVAASVAAVCGGDDRRALALQADVTDPAAIGRAVEATVARFGGLDVLVANAGIAPDPPAPVRRMPAEEFERVVEVDLLGVYRTVRAGMEEVVARGGQIVVVSSVYAFMNGMLNAPYAAAKAGVEQLGRALRAELAPQGTGVTVAYFGFVDTEMVRQALDRDRGKAEGGNADGLLPAFVLRRITPQAAAEALAQAIERRRPRLVAPRWWAAFSALRGLVNPAMDAAVVRLPQVRELLGEAERAAE
jgi:NAD(P)-dependent dehydrogenase (short-subunit alcohol dehydrogenase family)